MEVIKLKVKIKCRNCRRQKIVDDIWVKQNFPNVNEVQESKILDKFFRESSRLVCSSCGSKSISIIKNPAKKNRPKFKTNRSTGSYPPLVGDARKEKSWLYQNEIKLVEGLSKQTKSGKGLSAKQKNVKKPKG